MDLRRLFLILRAGFRRILIAAVATGAVVFLLGLVMLKYEAIGTVTVHPVGLQTEDSLVAPAVGMVFSPELALLQNHGQSYLGIVGSRTVIEQVVDRLGLDRAEEAKANRGLGRALEGIKKPVRLVLYGRPQAYAPTARDRAIKKTKDAVSASLIPSSDIIELTAQHSDSSTARDICNTVADVFVEFGQRRAREAASNALVFVQAQLAAARELRDARKKELDETKAAAGLSSYDDLAQRMAQSMAKLKTAEDALEAHDDQQPVQAERLRALEAALAEIPDYERLSYAMNRNPAIERLQQNMLNLRIEIQQQLIDYLPTSPQVEVRTNQLALLDRALRQEVEKLLQSENFQMDARRVTLLGDRLALQQETRMAPHQRKNLLGQIERHRARLAGLDALNARFVQLQRAFTVLEQREADLVLSVERTKAVASQVPSEVRILDRAQAPRYPGLKGTPLIVFVILAGAGAAVVAAAGVIYRA